MAGGWKVGMLMRGLFCDDILCAAATVSYFLRNNDIERLRGSREMTGDARKVVMLMRVRGRGRGRERSCHLFPLLILWIPYLIISKAISSSDGV